MVEQAESHTAGSLLFALAGRADADNIVPVIWEVSKDGRHCDVIVADRELFDSLSNAWWRVERPSVQLHSVIDSDHPPTLGQRLRRIARNRWVLRRFLKRQATKLVVVQWGGGIAHDSSSFIRRAIRWWSTGFAVQLQHAASDLGIPVVALPHGHSTKVNLVASRHVQETKNAHGGKLPFADRDSFAAYVFCSEYHREAVVGGSTMSGENVQVWGSARFNDVWVPKLYAESKEANLPKMPTSAIRRVLFFVPKWQNLVDRLETMRLIEALGSEQRIQLVMRGHLRAEAAALEPREKALLESGGVVLVTDDVTSPSLIKACDVVVDVDSSIAFDAIILGKPYVRPRYLQDSSVVTIWDSLGGAYQPSSLKETLDLLTTPSLMPAKRDPTFDDVVFGGRGSEVLARYAEGLRAIANYKRV